MPDISAYYWWIVAALLLVAVDFEITTGLFSARIEEIKARQYEEQIKSPHAVTFGKSSRPVTFGKRDLFPKLQDRMTEEN